MFIEECERMCANKANDNNRIVVLLGSAGVTSIENNTESKSTTLMINQFIEDFSRLLNLHLNGQDASHDAEQRVKNITITVQSSIFSRICAARQAKLLSEGDEAQTFRILLNKHGSTASAN